MADNRIEPKKSWSPMVMFFGVVVAAVVLLWWVSRPAPSQKSPQASQAPSALATAVNGPPSTARELCSVDQVKKFIATKLAAGEVPDSDLQQISAHLMDELTQAGRAQNGCVSPADVAGMLYALANQPQGQF